MRLPKQDRELIANTLLEHMECNGNTRFIRRAKVVLTRMGRFDAVKQYEKKYPPLRDYEEFYSYGLSAGKSKIATDGQRRFDEKLTRIDHEFKTCKECSRATIAEAFGSVEDIEMELLK